MAGLELHKPASVIPEGEVTATFGAFSAQPFERGWGVTVGNSLRRILLSSVEGAAVVAVRFAGVSHEYDSIPGVMEDVTDLILNLKRVPLRVHGAEEVRATLRGSGPGVLTSSAIEGGSSLEVVDPGMYLATLSDEGQVDAELVIRRGRGYVPADELKSDELGVGFIVLDAAFSPVRKANFKVEAARVGQATDYEKLILEVWTNGATTPQAAVAQAARLLADHLPLFTRLAESGAAEAAPQSDDALDRDIDTLELGGRITNLLRNAGVHTVRELVTRGEDELTTAPGFGKKALNEVRERLEGLGLSLGMRFDLPR
ncbi:MAG: DNA-directed RNA polymerase subunit alpha [Acidobacteriota bacterium]|jgi:DNA-directed RNA polymerase subunit alpha